MNDQDHLHAQDPNADRGRASGGGQLDENVASTLRELARSLQAEPNLQKTFEAVVAAAVATIPQARHAGITLVSRIGKRVSTPAASDALVERIDQLQYSTGQGPCLSAVEEQATVRADDLAAERRWPRFASAAVGEGVRSMLSFQLYLEAEDLGALNLYAADPDVFDAEAEQIGLMLASHAAVAMVGAQRQHHFHTALASRDLIGQAKGILMERHKITAEQAFDVLVRASQSENRKLHDIARVVADTGQDPARMVGRRNRDPLTTAPVHSRAVH